jgi:uncharacterized membrane protein YedE/YeeE
MVNPANVKAFLDVTGAWQPSLLYTMAAAVGIAAPAFWWARRSKNALLGSALALPDRFRIDRSLVLGSAIFGIGWGLSGICPGPALLLLSRPDRGPILFALGLAIGMLAARFRASRKVA